MRVAVTGATGFIGRHLTTYLVDRGVEVRAIVRPGSPNAAAPGATVVLAPLETSALVEAFAGVDSVVHLAGIVSTVRPQAFMDVNVEGTRAVAAAARQVSARLVHISSLAAAGPAPPAAPRREDDAPNPITPYGRSKLEGERVVQSMGGLAWTILRPGVVYGPGDRALLPIFRFAMHGVLPLVGHREAAYMFMHVTDAVRAIDAALRTAGHGDVMFIGHPHPVTALEVLQSVRTALNRRAAVVRIPAGILQLTSVAGELAGRAIGRALPLNRSRHAELAAEGFVCHVDRVRERLGVVATMALPEGFADVVSWVQERRLALNLSRAVTNRRRSTGAASVAVQPP